MHDRFPDLPADDAVFRAMVWRYTFENRSELDDVREELRTNTRTTIATLVTVIGGIFTIVVAPILMKGHP